MKLFVNWKKKYKELKNSYDFKCSVIDKQRIELNTVRQSNKMSDKIIAEKNEEIEELKRKLDILYAYYDLDKEATQEIKSKIRIDNRVWELELEVARLKAQLDFGFLSIARYCNPNIGANVSQTPYLLYPNRC